MVKQKKTLRISNDDFRDDSPLDWSEIVEVWYRGDSRYTLGNHPVSNFYDEFVELLRQCEPSREAVIRIVTEAFVNYKLAYPEYAPDSLEQWMESNGWFPLEECDTIELIDLLEEFEAREERLIEEIENTGKAVVLPAYAYIHSGVALSLSGFSCPWDSGQFGFVVIRPSDVQKEWNGDLSKAENYAKAVFGQWDQYVRGDVFCFLVEDEEGDIIDSLCGIYFDDDKSPYDDDDVIEMAKIVDVLDSDDDSDNVTVETSW